MAQETTAFEPTLEQEFEQLTNKYITPQVGKAREAAEQVQKLHLELMSKMERGTAPDDQAVRDLEAEKIERETEWNALREEVRGLQLELKQAHAQPEGKAERGNFDGALIRDIAKVRDAIRQYGTLDNAMQARAIDTSVISSAGALNADQENRFMDWLVEKQVALSRVSVRPMRSPEAYLDELITASRNLRAGTENTAPTVSNAFTAARRSLTTKETIWAEDLTKSFLEDNIERAGAENHIMMNLALAFGNDHNDLFWNGDEALAATITDTTPVDGNDDTTGLTQNDHTFLRINNGVIAVAKADAAVNDYDATAAESVQAILAGMLRDMAYDYAIRPGLTYFLPYKSVLIYADELTTRGTAFADQILLGGLGAARYFGLPVIPEPDLNRNSYDEGMLTFAENLVWGVQRGITVESEWSPRKRAVEITISARTDQNYAKSAAVVLADNIPAALR